jgi:hypothetical protein
LQQVLNGGTDPPGAAMPRPRRARHKKVKSDNGLRRSHQRVRGMARALQKWLRGTRRPVSTFFNHLTGDDSWTWQK